MKQYCPWCMEAVSSVWITCPQCGKVPASYQSEPHHLPPGTLIQNRYVVGQVLGSGGFGITYLGWDTTMRRKLAIKEYYPSIFVSRDVKTSLQPTCITNYRQDYEKYRAAFLREARMLVPLNRVSSVVQVYDCLEENNTAYIIMEFLEGQTLESYIRENGILSAEELLSAMQPLLKDIRTIHSRNIIHRDIKPANIMRIPDGKLILIDFGCARDVDSEHTLTTMVSKGYAPIEQYSGCNQGPWTDIYSLCATIYHCTTGKTLPASVERVGRTADSLIPPSRLGVHFTPTQEAALMKGLSVEAEDRWQSMEELYNALYSPEEPVPIPDPEGTETVQPSNPSKPQPVARTRRKPFALIALLVLVLAAAGAAFWFVSCGPSTVTIAGETISVDVTELDLQYKNLTEEDLRSLSNLKKLEKLDLGTTNISDLSALRGLTNLEWLSLYNNNISDLSPLENLTKLTVISLSVNNVHDLSPLRGLTGLTALYLRDNDISDLSPLEGLTNLESLSLYNNDISDLSPLEGLTNLELLALYDNNISDLSPLEGLTNLETLSLHNNKISDLTPLNGLTNLTELYLSGNDLSQEQVQALRTALPNCIIDYW